MNSKQSSYQVGTLWIERVLAVRDHPLRKEPSRNHRSSFASPRIDCPANRTFAPRKLTMIRSRRNSTRKNMRTRAIWIIWMQARRSSKFRTKRETSPKMFVVGLCSPAAPNLHLYSSSVSEYFICYFYVYYSQSVWRATQRRSARVKIDLNTLTYGTSIAVS